MKRTSTVWFGLCLMGLVLLWSSCTPAGNAEATFWVRGNCEMCKERIEDALTLTRGVTRAQFDIDAGMVTVRYDSTLVTPEALHQACADVGHETKSAPAPAAAHDALPKCCQRGQSM